MQQTAIGTTAQCALQDQYDPGRGLNEKQAAQRLGISVALLRKHRSKGIGCPYFKIGRRVVYCEAAVSAFKEACTKEAK